MFSSMDSTKSSTWSIYCSTGTLFSGGLQLFDRKGPGRIFGYHGINALTIRAWIIDPLKYAFPLFQDEIGNLFGLHRYDQSGLRLTYNFPFAIIGPSKITQPGIFDFHSHHIIWWQHPAQHSEIFWFPQVICVKKVLKTCILCSRLYRDR